MLFKKEILKKINQTTAYYIKGIKFVYLQFTCKTK